MNRVFTYGTLMFDAVWELVVGRPNRFDTAVLTGFRRCAAVGRVYPVLVPGGGELPGRLYLDVDDKALTRLDAFEGSEYERLAVQVRARDGELMEAWAYVLHPARQAIALDRDWDAASFERSHLAVYLARHGGSAPQRDD